MLIVQGHDPVQPWYLARQGLFLCRLLLRKKTAGHLPGRMTGPTRQTIGQHSRRIHWRWCPLAYYPTVLGVEPDGRRAARCHWTHPGCGVTPEMTLAEYHPPVAAIPPVRHSCIDVTLSVDAGESWP